MRLVVILSTAVALALLAARMLGTGSAAFAFLAWNLALAWVPLVLSTALSRLAPLRLPLPAVLALLAAWLAFFPNAPYVVTDFVHLHQRASAPLWFDIALLFSFAWAAGLCAVVSLRQVHGLILARTNPIVSWAFVVVTAVLTGFGIYLGRFDRFNTWDVVTRPRALGHGIAALLVEPTPRLIGVTVVFALLLLLVYVAAAPSGTPARNRRA